MDNSKTKYGLILNTKNSIQNNNPSSSNKSNHIKTFVSGLHSDSSDDEDINANIRKQQMLNSNKIGDEISKQLLQDSNVYEYDSIYDDVKSKSRANAFVRENGENGENNNTLPFNKPKYIDTILAATEKRKIERSIIQEKMEKKKREREHGIEFDDKPKFITKAYEEKLSLDKKREAIIIKNERDDEKKTINSENGMMGFYSSLLTKNSAYGGGRRGEGDDNILKIYNQRKSQYEKSFEKVKEDEDVVQGGYRKSKELKGKDKDKEEYIETKIDSDSDDKNNGNKLEDKEIFPPLSKSTCKADKFPESNISENKCSVEDFKARYLERKRNRPSNE